MQLGSVFVIFGDCAIVIGE